MKRCFETIKLLRAIELGKYYVIRFKSTKVVKGVICTKVSEMVVRFVNYAHVKGVEIDSTKPSTRKEITIVPNVLKFNLNKKSMLLMAETTNNKNHKAKREYYINGVESTQEEYETYVPKRISTTPLIMFTPLLENVLEIKKLGAE